MRVSFTVGNQTEYRSLPYLDALAFHSAARSGWPGSLFDWPIVFGECDTDREYDRNGLEDRLAFRMQYGPNGLPKCISGDEYIRHVEYVSGRKLNVRIERKDNHA